MDVLTDVLNALGLKGWISKRNELAPPWRYDFAASQDMIFHLLSSGDGYLSVEGDPTPRLGTQVMLRRLTELLFIHVIRVWVEQQAASTPGWVAALRDQPISTALGLIHQSPEHGWKVEELAEAVALSRSVFSARFTRLLGEPPITYLTPLRMHRANLLLKDNVGHEKNPELHRYVTE